MLKPSTMAPDRLREIRASKLNLTRSQLADALGLGKNGHRTIARYEAGDEPVSGPIALAAEALADGWRPAHMRATPALSFAASR